MVVLWSLTSHLDFHYFLPFKLAELEVPWIRIPSARVRSRAVCWAHSVLVAWWKRAALPRSRMCFSNPRWRGRGPGGMIFSITGPQDGHGPQVTRNVCRQAEKPLAWVRLQQARSPGRHRPLRGFSPNSDFRFFIFFCYCCQL